MKIILVRHGQTEWNALKKYQGQSDIPLNDVGKEQAARAGDYIAKNENIEAIYCSDLSRTKETAQIIADKLGLGLDPIADERLRELFFGLWEGLTFTEVYEQYREEFNNWFNDTLNVKVPEGESFSELVDRSMAAIKEISQKHKGTVVVVTHGGVIKAILSQSGKEKDLWQKGVEPASLTYLEINDGILECKEVGVIPD